MMINLRQSKGITLIALVITIIVLLILAGVAISMLSGENGIINKTNSAKTENANASTEEQVKIAVMTALAEGYGKIEGDAAFTALNKGLKDAGYSGEIDGETVTWPVEVTIGDTSLEISQNGTVSEPTKTEEIPEIEAGVVATEKSMYVDVNNDVAIIPERFRVSSVEKEKIIDKGMVVIAPDESEFVWVPVEDINSMVMCQGSTGANDCNIEKSGDKLVCTTHPGNDICGKLYATSAGEKFDSKLDTQKYSDTSELREPAVLTSTSHGDCITGDSKKGVGLIRYFTGMNEEEYPTDEDVINKWTENLQDEFNEMAKSVYENKGFYVGRCETSLDGDKAQSKANKPSASAGTKINGQALTWYGLYQIEKDYNKKAVNGNTLEGIVGSTMIWGSQYDQMMLWMYDNGKGLDITSTNSTRLNGATKNTSTTTGAEENDKLNNIYDLLGCKYEWALDVSDVYSTRTVRGDYSTGFNLSPSCRGNYSPYSTDSNISSRATLYIK